MVKDLVIVKTFVGLKFQEAILKQVASHTGKSYWTSDPAEEAKGIDGYIGDHPVSIKPQSYESKQMLPESIGVQIIYYDKVKDGINIFFEEFTMSSNQSIQRAPLWTVEGDVDQNYQNSH